jgi:hypothetical protein
MLPWLAGARNYNESTRELSVVYGVTLEEKVMPLFLNVGSSRDVEQTEGSNMVDWALKYTESCGRRHCERGRKD